MGNRTTDSSSGRVAERKRRSRLVDVIIRLMKEKPLGTVGMVITLLLLFTGIFADFLAPHGMNEITADYLAAPSAKFWLGTDNLGRDILSRVIFGARVSVIVGLAASALATSITVIIGMLCGYIGGKFDMIVQRVVVDTAMCFPNLILLMIIMSMLGPGMLQLIIAIGIFWGVVDSRVIRGVTISVRENLYVQAAVAIGSPTRRILTRHILPNILAPIIMMFSIQVPSVILAEASLSFLGFGIPPPTPSWGGMLSGTGRSYMYQAPWIVIWPGLALAIVVYGVNMFGDALRDILDPRLKGGVGRYGGKSKKGKKGGKR